MGVINLGLLVDKVLKKLEGAGIIKSTDYATASKAGVIKVGVGLSVTEAGVLSAGGTEVLQVYSGALSGSSGTKDYTVSLTGKTLLFMNAEINNESYVTCISVARWTAGQSASINSFTSGTYTLKLTKTETGLSYSGSDRFKYLEVYAI